MPSRPRARFLIAGLAALLVIVGVPFIGVQPATAAVDTSGFCANAPDSDPFTDVADNDSNVDNIRCLLASGITVGVTPTTYVPAGSVTRRQMALFIKRLIDTANELERTNLEDLPPPGGPSGFSDVGSEEPEFQEAIAQLDAAGIIDGFGDGTYRPGESVSRGQMAKFITNAVEFMLRTQLPPGGDAFGDDNGNVFEPFINKLAAADIVDGITAGVYGPNQDVSRRQMASFLIRTLAALFNSGSINPLPGDDGDGDADADGTDSDGMDSDGMDSDGGEGDPVTVDAQVTDGLLPLLVGELSLTDVISLTFDEEMSPPESGDSFTFSDADGTQVTFTCMSIPLLFTGCNLSGDTTITATVGVVDGLITTVEAGLIPGVQYPGEITAQEGFTDLEGNEWDVANSPDTTLDAGEGGIPGLPPIPGVPGGGGGGSNPICAVLPLPGICPTPPGGGALPGLPGLPGLP